MKSLAYDLLRTQSNTSDTDSGTTGKIGNWDRVTFCLVGRECSSDW